MRVRHRLILLATTIQVAFAFSCAGTAHGQTRIVLKSGESTEFGPTYWIANCKSLVIGLPVIEVLEGPPELILTFKEGMVTARRQNCPNKVAGGTVVVT